MLMAIKNYFTKLWILFNDIPGSAADNYIWTRINFLSTALVTLTVAPFAFTGFGHAFNVTPSFMGFVVGLWTFIFALLLLVGPPFIVFFGTLPNKREWNFPPEVERRFTQLENEAAQARTESQP